jgi:cytochrome c peroxidase
MLKPVRDSWSADAPLRWTRVHDLPDYVYFNHSVHVAKGVGCNTCHGQVDQMPLTYKAASLQMDWCLSCHREPERFVRPKDQVFNMKYLPPGNQVELGKKLVADYHIRTDQLTNCAICHR